MTPKGRCEEQRGQGILPETPEELLGGKEVLKKLEPLEVICIVWLKTGKRYEKKIGLRKRGRLWVA